MDFFISFLLGSSMDFQNSTQLSKSGGLKLYVFSIVNLVRVFGARQI